jgi:hypothetical protein
VIWATRRRCHVDRTASAWLIERFVDPEARFVFVDDPDEVPAGATPFDIAGAELSHHDGRCSFESIVCRYELDDPALEPIARIVHEADIGDERYDAPEAAGIDVVVRALGRVARDDEELLALARPIFDGLYAVFSRNPLGR